MRGETLGMDIDWEKPLRPTSAAKASGVGASGCAAWKSEEASRAGSTNLGAMVHAASARKGEPMQMVYTKCQYSVRHAMFTMVPGVENSFADSARGSRMIIATETAKVVQPNAKLEITGNVAIRIKARMCSHREPVGQHE